MNRILFVDDEPEVLEGLARVLYRHRRDWEMAFAGSAAAALTALDQRTFDVVVTDMRMPETNGAELLNIVAKKHPRVIRIVLSGQADRRLIMECSEATHQFVYKPCDEVLLLDIVSRAIELRDILAAEPLLSLVSGLRRLPTRPAHYSKISELLSREDVPIGEISHLISSDISMCAKVLQLANSAAYTWRGKLTNIEMAVQLLGIDNLRSMVLAAEVFRHFDDADVRQEIDALWDHSIRVGKLALMAGRSAGVDRTLFDEAYAAGILHDVGKLVLLSSLPRDYTKARHVQKKDGLAFHEAEKSVLGVSHMEVGAYLLGLWGLPSGVVEAAAFHHYPWRCAGTAASPLAFAALANAADNRSLNGTGDPAANDPAFLEFGEKLGLLSCFPLGPEEQTETA